RERDLDGDQGALAMHRLDVDGAADLVDIGAHHVHAHPAPGDRGDGGGGGEAGREDELVDLRLGHLLELGLGDEAASERLGLDLLGVGAAVVVSDADDDVAALVIGGEADGAGLGLAGRLPLGCMRVFMTPSCSSAVTLESRCSGTLNSESSLRREISRSWLRVSTSSETMVMRCSRVSTLTRI